MFILGVIANRMRIQNIEFVGGYTEAYDGTTSDKVISLESLTGGLDTKPSEGDIVVVINGAYGEYGANLPTGYTQVLSNTYGRYYRVSAKLAYKFIGGTPDTSLIIPGGTGGTDMGGSTSILVFRNVNTVTPLDVSAVYYTASNTVKPNPPSITPVTTGAVIIAGGVGGYNNGVQLFTSSDLTNFISSCGDDNFDCTTGIGYKEWISGAFDPAQFGFTGTDSSNNSSIGYTIALRPK